MAMNAFLKDDQGAVTVDWVVLTAGLVGLGLATMTVVSSGVEDVSTDIDETLTNDNGPSIIRTAFTSALTAIGDGETLAGVTAYGETGRTLEASDALGAAKGDNAYVITTGSYTPGGALSGGLYANFGATPMEIGETYRVSYWARAEEGNVTVRAFTYGDNADGNWGYDGGSNGYETVSTDWTYVEYEFTAQNDGTRIYIAADGENLTYALDDIQIEKVD